MPNIASIKGLGEQNVWTHVETRQIAPSILKALDLDPVALKSVQLEGTAVLTGFEESLHAWSARKGAVLAAR